MTTTSGIENILKEMELPPQVKQRLQSQLSSPLSYEKLLQSYVKAEAEKAVLEEEKAAYMDKANKDDLTGLHNLRYWNSIDSKIQRASEKYVVGILDLDHMKKINDTYGHDAGNKVIKAMGKAMNSLLKHDDEKVRYGGDEFTFVLYNIRDEKDIEKRLDVLGSQIRYNVKRETGYDITVSMGAVICRPETKTSLKEAFDMADKKLYQSKEQGRNRASINYNQCLEAA